jgi:hypothetical protein
MISEQAAFVYALLRAPVALYPRSIFRRYFPLTDEPYGAETLNRLREPLAQYQERLEKANGQEKAFLHLLVQGATSALEFLETTDELAGWDPMATIEKYYEVVEEYYPNRLGLAWNHNPPVITDYYPEPATQYDWFAVSNVPGGPRPGYPQGVYFLRRYMMPGVAELATLHENVHHLGMGASSTGGYYRYFDEGCANWIAYLVYHHKNGHFEGVDLFRTFLQEFNADLYESPPFDRILAALVHQVGMTGLYRLIVRRLQDVTTEDWQELLRATAAGEMRIEPRPGEPSDADLPSIVHELQAGADRMIARILYPERLLMSPVAFQGFTRMCEQGFLEVSDLQETWHLSPEEMAAVTAELEDVYLWKLTDGRLSPSMFRSDLFHDTGLVRAADAEHLRADRRALRRA